MPSPKPLALVLAALVAAPAAARAEAVLKPYQPAPTAARAPAVDIAPNDPALAAITALRRAGLAQTAVDRRFAARGDGPGLTGSLGFLCGREPGQTEKGGDAAYGYDPHGRFVGARLSLAF